MGCLPDFLGGRRRGAGVAMGNAEDKEFPNADHRLWTKLNVTNPKLIEKNETIVENSDVSHCPPNLPASTVPLRVLQALADGYMERRPRRQADPEFERYFEECARLRRPFVRVESRRGKHSYRVEADLICTPGIFTGSLYDQTQAICAAFASGRSSKATFGITLKVATCAGLTREQALRLAGKLFAYTSTAPSCC